ncbi:hypothetical protein FQN49_002675 [Arthroderma sp. PD_2]|nr:hypothetical protein FQN49_002675 [Arthroderma sp. PD_2]
MGIYRDADMPACLNTRQKQEKWAKMLALKHSGIPAKKARGPGIQGCFSRTILVILKNGEEAIIQFRVEPLDMEPFHLARKYLGPVVPEIRRLEDEEELKAAGIQIFWMNRIPGETWLRALSGHGEGPISTICKSLGRVLSKGHIEGSCDTVIDTNLRPHLEMIVSSSCPEIAPYQDLAKDLIGKLDQLKVLPLFISHFDMNAMNILVDKDFEVSGIVDWELSSPLPFGVSVGGRIHSLAGEYHDRKFYMPENFVESEEGLWQELFDGVPADIRKTLDANIDVVQTAVMVGTLLDAFPIVDGKLIESFNPAVMHGLPKFVTYRIPPIRGSDAPYSE